MTEQAIYDQAWLEARANVASILVQHGILDTRNDIAGFWSHDGFGNSTWVSIYDLMEANK